MRITVGALHFAALFCGVHSLIRMMSRYVMETCESSDSSLSTRREPLSSESTISFSRVRVAIELVNKEGASQ